MFKKILKFLIKWGFVFGIWLSIFFMGLVFYYSRDLPDLNSLAQNSKNIQNLSLYYSDDLTLIRQYGNVSKTGVSYYELPGNLVQALLATEDRRFFKHFGIDIIGIIRAFYVNYRSGQIKQGGSGLTQQLAKMLFLSPERTLKRKIQEALLALQLERKFSKEEIMAFYLNKSYFGAGKYGIGDAAKFYFGKDVSQLDLEECAMLVGLLKAPSKYSPVNNPDLTKSRTKQVILNMKDAGFLTSEETENYIKTNLDEIQFFTFAKSNQNYFFADWIKGQIYDYIDTTDNNIAVDTTLDKNYQSIAEDVVYNFVEENKEKLNKSQVAMIVMAKDGAVMAMIGGTNYGKNSFNRAVHAYRQPGSAFKTIVFLTGLKNGMTPESRFIDEPIAVGNWYPQNYGKKYYGDVSAKFAFAQSLNSVAVQISEMFGTKEVARMAKRLGITSEIDQHDPTIALGTTQVNLLELTSVYATIINDGYPVIPYAIKDIKQGGRTLYQRKTSGLSRVLNDKEITGIKEMLYAVVMNGTGKNAKIESLIRKTEDSENKLLFRKKKYYIGGKTGTSQNFRDAWFIGYVNDIVIGVWIGNDDDTATEKVGGGNLPVQLWRDFAINVTNE